jgi:23S rRNA (cytosine1962-C5)-methyltransferase
MTFDDTTYTLIDSGNLRKLEQVGPYRLIRYAPSAAYKPTRPELWKEADATYHKNDKGGGEWEFHRAVAEKFAIELPPFEVQVKLTPFGHLGIFPEQRANWDLILSLPEPGAERPEVLNLFAYSGLSSLACLKRGYGVCHVDSSKGMVEWASENARLSGLENRPIRYIVDDVMKFVQREVKRGKRYQGIILDPPTFGRGAKGEVWKLEDEITGLMDLLMQLCGGKPDFVIFSCHTQGFGPLNLERILRGHIRRAGTFASSELSIPEATGNLYPSGASASFVAS